MARIRKLLATRQGVGAEIGRQQAGVAVETVHLVAAVAVRYSRCRTFVA
jgi:hypothetical protein